MKKRILPFLLVIVLAVSLCLSVNAAFDPNTRNSVVVVAICFDDLDGNEYTLGWGTGFFVGKPGENPSYLVTNHHVVEDFIDLGQGELVEVPVDGGYIDGRAKIHVNYDSRDFEEGYLVGYDAIKDLAIVKLAGPTSKRVPLPITTPTDNMVGSTVYALGYPGLAENVLANATTSWGMSDCTVTKGTVSRLFRTQGTGVAGVQIDLVIKHGNSGGPLVTEDNVCIGVNTWGVESGGESLNYAISIEEVIPLLKRYSVDYTDGAYTEPAPEGDELIAPAPEAKASFPLWAIILIGVLALGAIVGVVIAILSGSKKKTAAAARQQQAQMQQQMAQMQQRPAAPVKKGGVRSLAQQHGGATIPVGAQPILLGRGQDCAVVYQSGTPGVSGRHCSLAFDAASGAFTLTDLQSTYGTFLANGQKLQPNMPYRLRAGDQFYLGEPQNKLQLTME